MYSLVNKRHIPVGILHNNDKDRYFTSCRLKTHVISSPHILHARLSPLKQQQPYAWSSSIKYRYRLRHNRQHNHQFFIFLNVLL
jgi:hypothetical protein